MRAMSSAILGVAVVMPVAAAMPEVPAGFSIMLAAGNPEIRFPMFAAFDDSGRLYVAESSGGDLYAELRNLERRCRISLLEDRDGDGRFEKAAVFADDLVMPMGLDWHDGRLFVAEGPAMIALEDTDGDGRADTRDVVLDGFGHTDNGSLHGTLIGPDDWLYMTIGQPDGYRFTDAAGRVVESRAGAVIRCRPDGSEPEVVTRGFENPIEIDFLPTGEIIGTANWLQLPDSGLRDGLVHHVAGGKYPRMADSGSRHPVTGIELPPLAMYPALSLSGMTRLRTGAFPAEWRSRIFTAQFNSRRVQAHQLVRQGASFVNTQTDFVTSADPDFHPSDVLEAPDGSLLVIDTGAWYVQHCPTGAIRGSDAPGGIYRVSAEEGGAGSSSATRLDAMWEASSEELRETLDDREPDRVALAARILGRRADDDAAAALAGLLEHQAPHVRLAAAEALAEAGTGNQVPALTGALTEVGDLFLRHALVFALWGVADDPDLEKLAGSEDAAVRETSRLLLDQRRDRSIPPPQRPDLPDPRTLPPLPPEATRPSAEELAKLKGRGAALKGGNPVRGRELFLGKASCAACHRVAGEGRAVGPDLSAIGLIRARPALLEAIVLPSATFAQRHEPLRLRMKDGSERIGMVVDQDGGTFLFRDAAGNESRLPRDRIGEIARLPTSLMPAGLDELLSDGELRDLLAYLEGLGRE